MSRKRFLIWGLPAFLYAAFVFWYTDFGGPLSSIEIASYLEEFEGQGLDQQAMAGIRGFMEGDSGRQFLMLNIIDLTDDPPDVEGAEPGESAQQLMNRYMEHMYAELFKRACHPTTMGNAVYRALDLVGVDGLDAAERWDIAAFMRYRSRRTFMEIVTIPETRGRHAFKVAALDKTIAYPIETEIYLGDPRLILALGLFSFSALIDLVSVRENSGVKGD